MGKACAALLAASVVTLTGLSSRGQDIVGPGSTIEGDRLRGEGQFLKGAAWYELNSAKAREINDRNDRENARFYNESWELFKRDQAANEARHKAMTRAQAEKARLDREAHELKLRTDPSASEISKGQALNALLIDLSAPSIASSSWRSANAQVPLPKDISISSLVFRLAGQAGDKSAKATSSNLIALGSLDPKNWPKILREEDLARERLSYEKVYRKIVTDSVGHKLSYKTFPELNKAVDQLAQKAKAVVPAEGGFRASAVQEIEGIRAASKMFNGKNYEFAQEMIADTTDHKATTVGELLAFMRKYRLVFASVERSPGGGEMYRTLYGLMREQKEKLGIKDAVNNLAKKRTGRDEDRAQPEKLQGTWAFMSNVMDGKDLPKVRGQNWTTSIADDKYVTKMRGAFMHSGMVKIDSTKDPVQVILTVSEGKEAGTVFMGIIRWDGDDLIQCLSKNEVPDKFESLPGQGRQLIRYSRVEP